ncbi:MAG TPA: Mur ligase domain-containing protein, partial [Trueperaceae bacterium]|nr:Mur ligase domain-containing protein [Trueperaceae bacterium]
MVEGRYSAGRGEAEDAAALLRPEALARLLGGRLPDELPGPGRGVAYDSRRVRPGDVFFARQGSAGHGVVHADAALAAGAAFVVSDAPHPCALLVDDAWAAMAAVAAAARALLRAPVVGV